MSIVVRLDVMLALRKMRSKDLAAKIDITEANLSLLKSGKVKGLRNLFLSQMRRARFKGEWDELTASKILAAPASQDRHIELSDMQRALMHLPQPQREALILVGAGGFAYEEAAEICGCAVGTIKSRVARGRVALEGLLSSGKLPSRRQHRTDPNKSALQTIMNEVDDLSRDHERAVGAQED